MTRRARIGLIGLAATVALAPATASAATPFVDIATPSGPLTRIVLGNELSCQIAYSGDAAFELYPSATTPGDCGTFVATGGTLFAPDVNNHGSTAASSNLGTNTPFTPVSQSGVTGSGSSGDPKRVTT